MKSREEAFGAEYLLFLVASRDDVIESALKFYPQFSCHSGSLAVKSAPVNTLFPESDPITIPHILILCRVALRFTRPTNSIC
jgi:hypothetical protein